MSVTQESLKKYKARKVELEAKKRRLANLRVEYVGDTVRNGDRRRGSIEKIEGYNFDVINQRAEELKGRIKELEEETLKIERWIKNLEEGHDRNIIELAYVDGLNGKDIAKEIGPGWTSDAVRQRMTRFWKRYAP